MRPLRVKEDAEASSKGCDSFRESVDEWHERAPCRNPEQGGLLDAIRRAILFMFMKVKACGITARAAARRVSQHRDHRGTLGPRHLAPSRVGVATADAMPFSVSIGNHSSGDRRVGANAICPGSAAPSSRSMRACSELVGVGRREGPCDPTRPWLR